MDEFKKTGVSIFQFVFDFFEGVSRCDVLGAVPVESLDGKDKETFDFGPVVGSGQLGGESGIIGDIFDLAGRPDFQALAGRVVDEEEHCFLPGVDITSADILPVSPKVGKAESPGTQHFEEALRPPPELHIGPAVFANGGKIEAVPRFDKGDLFGGHCEAIGFLFQVRIVVA